ncbi:hypothetical protein [Sphingomonas sp.]|uniref:hypothetical protein n=1 Tax=Sphingomonas sp. TaxID=28214 RepID=UPI003CC64DAA
MPTPRQRLAFIALGLVESAANECGTRALERTPALSLAIGYLWSISDGPLGIHPSRRAVFDAFWAIVTATPDLTRTQEEGVRRTYAQTCVEQMRRQVRMTPRDLEPHLY